MRALTQMQAAVTGLRSLPVAERREAVKALLPDLEALAKDEAVTEETRAGLVMKVLRAVSPRAVQPGTVGEAVEAVRSAVNGARGRGRPAIGPATTVRLPADAYEWLDEMARHRGLVDGAGEPLRGAAIRAVVEEAMATDLERSSRWTS